MPTQTRINSIDLLRGIVMIIMALDHTRDFFHITAWTDDPLNLQTTSPALYITRWITHLCAPTFVFLSGTSAYFVSLRRSKKQLSLFLLTRGLWLIFVELAIITLALTFDLSYQVSILQVIWAIGASMVVLSAVIWLPFRLILAIGLIIVAGHNLLDVYEQQQNGNLSTFYKVLHVQSMVSVGGHQVLIFYPFLAWSGVMMLGYCFGKYYLGDIMNRNKRSMLLGATLLILFIALRFADVYGDPLGWSVQKSPLYTFFSFINAQKYPPSLLFLCVTLGISMVILGLLGDAQNRVTRFITVFGRVPLFYYIIHFYLLHLISACAFLARGHSFNEGAKGMPGALFKFVAPSEGYSLGVVYFVWIAVVLMLYPLCKWFADYKRDHRQWWVSYL
jgi:uncharacterized membrane protein